MKIIVTWTILLIIFAVPLVLNWGQISLTHIAKQAGLGLVTGAIFGALWWFTTKRSGHGKTP